MKIFVINGIPKCGKDTFIGFVDSLYDGRVCNISTVDVIKDVATLLGWEGTKTTESRNFLSDLKDLSTRFNGFPFHNICEKVYVIGVKHSLEIDTIKEPLVFIHSREIPEVARFKNELGAETILVVRDIPNEGSRHSDTEVANYDYDYTIYNDQQLEGLQESARQFVSLNNQL